MNWTNESQKPVNDKTETSAEFLLLLSKSHDVLPFLT